jgi:hypothetical protein
VSRNGVALIEPTNTVTLPTIIAGIIHSSCLKCMYRAVCGAVKVRASSFAVGISDVIHPHIAVGLNLMSYDIYFLMVVNTNTTRVLIHTGAELSHVQAAVARIAPKGLHRILTRPDPSVVIGVFLMFFLFTEYAAIPASNRCGNKSH